MANYDVESQRHPWYRIMFVFLFFAPYARATRYEEAFCLKAKIALDRFAPSALPYNNKKVHAKPSAVRSKMFLHEYESNKHEAEQAFPAWRGAGRSSRGTRSLLDCCPAATVPVAVVIARVVCCCIRSSKKREKTTTTTTTPGISVLL